MIVCRNEKETKGGRKSSINTSTTVVLLKLYVLLNVAKLPFSGEVCCSLPTTKRRSDRSSPKKLYLSLAVLPTIYTYNIYSLTPPHNSIPIYSHSRSIILSHKIPFYNIQSRQKRIINFFLCLLIHSFPSHLIYLLLYFEEEEKKIFCM